MLKHLHMTARQWKIVLKWALHSLLFLVTLVAQDVILAKHPIFGIKLTVVPLLIVCVCIREGPESGGVFALITSVICCYSGADYGNVSVALLPVCSILAAVFCRRVLTLRFLSTLLCCLLVLLIHETVILGLKVLLTPISPKNLFTVVLPRVGLSLPALLIQYPLAKTIHKTGGSHDL